MRRLFLALLCLAFALPEGGEAEPASRPVLVVQRPVRAGERVVAAAVAVEARSVSEIPRDAVPPSASLEGLRARRRLHEGRVLRAAYLEEATDVRRGAPVRLVWSESGLRIETTARALRDGNRGERIPVRNLESGRTVQARVVADGVVHAEP